MQAALGEFQFDAGVLDLGILRENRRQRPDAAGPLLLVHHQVFDRLHRFHRLGMREIVELLVLLHVAHGGPLARNGFHRRFVRRIRHQPEVAAKQRVGIFQRKTLQVVSRPAAEAARKVAVVELVIADADVHVGRAEAFPAPRQQAAQSRRHGEGLLLVDHVLDEIGRFQVGQRKFARAVDLIAHGLEDRVGRRGLRGQDAEGAQHDERLAPIRPAQCRLHKAARLISRLPYCSPCWWARGAAADGRSTWPSSRSRSPTPESPGPRRRPARCPIRRRSIR